MRHRAPVRVEPVLGVREARTPWGVRVLSDQDARVDRAALRLDAELAVPTRKRAHAPDDDAGERPDGPDGAPAAGETLVCARLPYRVAACGATADGAADAGATHLPAFHGGVHLHTVANWVAFTPPAELFSPALAGVVALVADRDETLVTLPVVRGERLRTPGVLASEWLLIALELAQRHTLELSARVALEPDAQQPHTATLDVYVTVRVPPGALHREQPEAAEALLHVVRFCNAPAMPPPHDAGADASLVYDSLCRRELHAETRMPEAEQPRELQAQLLPFQRRSVAFLLERETPPAERGAARAACGLWWVRVARAVEQTGAVPPLFLHLLTGELSTAADRVQDSDVRGAMLAEEMGLGKTVEVLALILLRAEPARSSLPAVYDAGNDALVQPVGTTLIVAPETLRLQWLDEVARHAPTLRVYSYTGHRNAARDARRAGHASFVAWACELEVVVVSFETLSRELPVSRTAPQRSMRHPAKYERPRSPLVQLEFLRVVMDEVQLVGGNAAKTIAMVRRRASIAVSGTPVRHLDDLRASLGFLGVRGAAGTARMWQRVLSPALVPFLSELLATVGIRHTKEQVQHEMVLPRQERMLVPVEFTSIEAAFYRDVWEESLAALDLDADGAPRSDTWQLDPGKLRGALLRLRQACTHPHVAIRGAGGTTLGGAGPGAPGGTGSGASYMNLRTIDHVLAMMLDTTRAELLSLRLGMLLKRIYRATVLLFAPREELQAPPLPAGAHADDTALVEQLRTRSRLLLAREQLETVLPETLDQIAQLEREMRTAQRQGPMYRFSDEELKRAEREVQNGTAASSGDAPLAEKVRVRQQHMGGLRNRLRHWVQLLHRVHQFLGHCYFQLGEERERECADGEKGAALARTEQNGKQEADEAVVSAAAKAAALGAAPSGAAEPAAEPAKIKAEHDPVPPADDAAPPAGSQPADTREELRSREDAAYAAAEATRQRLLAEAREAVEQSARSVERQRLALHLRDLTTESAPRARRGLVGQGLVEELERLATLDEHARLLLQWREQILERLLKPVNREVNKERENDDVYAENLDAQIEAETLMEMYRPLLAQREELLTGRIALGSTARPQLFTELDRALRGARTRRLALDAPDEEAEDDETAKAQRLQLTHFQQLESARQAVSLPRGAAPLAALGTQLRELGESALPQEELEALNTQQARVRAVLRTQTQLLERMRREQALFQTLFNTRSLYFKQIQELSDQVQDPDFADGAVPSMLAALAQERAWRKKIGALEGRQRYLQHLEQMQLGDGGEEAGGEARRCFICYGDIHTGILTNACGHLCCEKCFYAWMDHGRRRTCPMCKTRLAPRDVHRVVYRREPEALGAAPGASGAGGAPGRFSVLDDARGAQMERVSIDGRFGSKLDLITKHLLHLHRTTGEKSLVFSSFTRGLDLVAESLRANGLPYARMQGSGRKQVGAVADLFQHSPTVNILLLHSEVQSAGLNLLAATHLHLLEPLLNHALELQALGRIHRIGGTRPTHVYCYMVSDTVEQRIVALAASRGQSLYLRREDAGDSNVAVHDSAALQAETLQNADDISREARRGDLVGSTEDLLACFFQEHIPGTAGDVFHGAAPPPDDAPQSVEELRARRLQAIGQGQ